MDVEGLTKQLSGILGVVAVCLGGSRARGVARPESDWDFGLYYRGRIDTAAVRALGFSGEVVEPGAWGRLVNGGAWLEVDGARVDLLYRDLDAVEHWLREAEGGRFEIDPVPGYIAGMATYVLVGELALNRVLRGDLPRPAFPAALHEQAPGRWWERAAFFLLYADGYAKRGEATACAGALAVAVMAAAQARMAERGEWRSTRRDWWSGQGWARRTVCSQQWVRMRRRLAVLWWRCARCSDCSRRAIESWTLLSESGRLSVTEGIQPGLLVLFGGPAGAGKSTPARAWCAAQARAVHIGLDRVREMIVGGRADPQQPDAEGSA